MAPPFSCAATLFRPTTTTVPCAGSPARPKIHSKPSVTVTNRPILKSWPLRSSLAQQNPPKQEQEEEATIDVNPFVDFLYDDLPHLFDGQGIDRTMYDKLVKFRDPITKHDTIDGYLFNIRLLKLLFNPDFQLHNVRQVIGSHSLAVPFVGFESSVVLFFFDELNHQFLMEQSWILGFCYESSDSSLFECLYRCYTSSSQLQQEYK